MAYKTKLKKLQEQLEVYRALTLGLTLTAKNLVVDLEYLASKIKETELDLRGNKK